MNINLYDKDFFKWHKEYVHYDSLEAGRYIAEHFNPESVIDYGCGIGSFIQGINEYDASIDIKGYEISKQAKLFINRNIIDKIEFKNILNIKDSSEISLCMEVAEHIDPENSEKLVKMLCDNTDNCIFFTAAPPGQEGTGHINCQPKKYWTDLFKQHGFKWDLQVTLRMIDNTKLADYYKNNLMIFIK